MRNTIKRITGFTMVIAAVISLLITVFTLVKIWQLKEPVTQNFLSGMLLISTTLETSAEGLEIAGQALETTQTSVGNLQTTIETLSQSIRDTAPLFNSLKVLMNTGIPKTIASIQASMASAMSSAKVIDVFLRALNVFSPDAYNPPKPLDQSLGDVSTSLDELPRSLVSMESNLDTTSTNLDTVQSQVDQIAADVGKIKSSLNEALGVVREYQKIVADLSKVVTTIHANLPLWMNIAAVGLTFLLLWLGVAQVGILLEGWEYFTGQD